MEASSVSGRSPPENRGWICETDTDSGTMDTSDGAASELPATEREAYGKRFCDTLACASTSMVADSRILVPTPPVPERATAVRGTVLMASQEALKKGGYFDRYANNVEDAYRKKLLHEIVPNTWLGIDQAMAHYRACEALCLEAATIQEMGTAVGDRINSVFVKSLITLASGAVQPWFAWQLAPRVWARAWKGSAVGVRKMGPTEARVDVVGFPCASIPYVRVSLAAFFAKNTQLFCRSAVARQVRPSSDPSESVSYTVSWI